jgi:uncharacterized membrane protein YphA (DoxX/SURF4 family)
MHGKSTPLEIHHLIQLFYLTNAKVREITYFLSKSRTSALSRAAAQPSYLLGGQCMLVSRQLNAAYWALRVAFGLGPLLAGADKFTNILVNWQQYLSPVAVRMLPVDPTTFMHAVGVIEIIVGLAILFGATRVFGYIAMLWLFAIAANLISSGKFYDIAVRDILLGIGAYSLARVTEARESVVYVDRRDEWREAA